MPSHPPPELGRRAPVVAAVAAVVVGAVAYGTMAMLDRAEGTLRAAATPTTVAWMMVAAAGFWLAVCAGERLGRGSATGSPPWWWIWLPPLAFRLLMLTTDPALSLSLIHI